MACWLVNSILTCGLDVLEAWGVERYMYDELLARAHQLTETATTIRETDPTGTIALVASAIVMAHVAVLRARGHEPTPSDERLLGAAVTEFLDEQLIAEDRLTDLLDGRDGLTTIDPDAALTDARDALERARTAVD